MSRFDDDKLAAFLRILKTTSSRSAQLMMYTFALGAIIAIPGSSLPAVFAAIATGIGVEALGSILSRVAFGENLSDEEIVERIREAVDESGIAEVLTTNKQAQEQLVRLASWQRHLKYVVETGNQEVLQNVAEQYQLISHDVVLIRNDLRKLATQAQGEDIKQSLDRIIFLLEANTPRTEVMSIDSEILANPYIVGPVIRNSDQFYGRDSDMRFIVGRIGAVAPQSISIVGERRIGKSSLIWNIRNQILETFPHENKYVFIYLDLSGAASRNNKALMSSLRRELFREKLPVWGEPEDGNLMAMCHSFEQLESLGGARLVICLDEFEYINAHPSEFDGLLETIRAEAQLGRITVITVSQSSLATLCAQGRIETSPFYNIFTELVLGLLDEDSWRRLVRGGFLRSGVHISQRDEDFILECAGLHPFFTQMSAALLWEQKIQSEDIDYEILGNTFAIQAEPHFEYMWRYRSDIEQRILKGQSTNHVVRRRLLNRGLLSASGEPFSQYFNRFVLAKP